MRVSSHNGPHIVNGFKGEDRLESSMVDGAELFSEPEDSENVAHKTNGVGHHNEPSDRPRKRRKLSEHKERGYSPPRPISPPWKKADVEGPTSFVEDGRRKSSRTNFIPLELQPHTEKRRTRLSAIQTTSIAKSRYGGAALKSTPATPDLPETPSRPGRRSFGYAKPNPQSGGRSQEIKSPPFSSKKHSSTKARSYSINSQQSPTKSYSRGKQTHVEPPVRRSGRSSKSMRSEFEEYGNSNGSLEVRAPDVSPNAHIPRLRFKVRMPQLPILSAYNIPNKRQHTSLRDWLENSFHAEETKKPTEEEAALEGQIRQRLLKEAEPGGVLSPDRCSAYLPEAQEEPLRQYSHHDHLVSQAVRFQILMRNEHKRHLVEAKRLAYAAAAEVQRRRPKSAEDIERELREQARVQYRSIMRDLQRKWNKVVDLINSRRLAIWQEEQDQIQKEALDNVLEHSTRLLDARRLNHDEQNSILSDQDSTDEDSGDSENGDSEDESNMSSSGSESTASSRHRDYDVDEGLTVEELRQKYTSAIEQETAQASDISMEGGEPHDEGLASLLLESRDESIVEDMEMPSVQLEEVDEILMDDSDVSIDMDDDMGDSEDVDSDSDDGEGPSRREESGDDAGSEDEENDGEEDALGLAGFYGSSFIINKPQKEISKDSTDTGMGLEVVQDEQHEIEAASHDSQTPHEDANLSSQASPRTIATTKQSEPDSRSSVEMHGSRHASSATTPQPAYILKTQVPFLLRGTLREYQHFGLDWLSNLYTSHTNGILADEMGLGKTIQTISLLAHLACEHEVWGPHLIVVPTSVMLNWEMEFKKWCPGFKILTYYGTQERRKELRKGWLNDDLWNVCITSYQLVLQDHQAFKRRNWHYMILDEAHHIKNFQSLKWQTLLTFKTKARLLLTGTPLQNGLDELWALLFFLMPDRGGVGGFADRQEFLNWFQDIRIQIIDKGADKLDPRTQSAVAQLHQVLRPFLLRRLKADVEKQMPPKFEHVVTCRLSKRQRHLYDEFMSRSATKDALVRGNAFSIMNCVMSLRKVCNHPDLFETRQIVTSYAMRKAAIADYDTTEALVRRRLLREEPGSKVSLSFLALLPVAHEGYSKMLLDRSNFLTALDPLGHLCRYAKARIDDAAEPNMATIESAAAIADQKERKSHLQQLENIFACQWLQLQKRPIYGAGLVKLLTLPDNFQHQESQSRSSVHLSGPSSLIDMMPTLVERSQQMETTIQKFAFVTPPIFVEGMADLTLGSNGKAIIQEVQETCKDDAFHEPRIRLSIAFPDKRLLQYDCGKLQQLDILLRRLQSGGHRALIFTQMTKVLDILEQFMNIHGHRYLRLDGQTKIEQRQILTERFNSDPRILAFILSSRSGGLGINLTGADTVIFYDLDWNPSADKQCQDRCHRIGQTREVHIYRLVSESTIESNILRKANQKRMLDNVVIQEGDFTTDYFNKLSVRDVLGDDVAGLGDQDLANPLMDRILDTGSGELEKVLEKVEDAEDVQAAKEAKIEEIQADEADFAEKDLSASRLPINHLDQADTLTTASQDQTATILPATADKPERILSKPAAPIIMAEPGHLDNYLIATVERQLQDVPLIIPADRLKNRVKKKNAHRVMKRN